MWWMADNRTESKMIFEMVGIITRSQRDEESVIDFILCNQKMVRNFKEMNIDEKKEIFDLSDHCLLNAKFSYVHGKVTGVGKTRKAEEIIYYKTNDEDLKIQYIQNIEDHLKTEDKATPKMDRLETLMQASAEMHLKKIIRNKDK